MNTVAKSLCIAGLFVLSTAASNAHGASGVVINEIMASNSQSTPDPQGQYDDWIELHNPTDAPIDIAGMYLTDNPGVPTKWRVPAADPELTRIEAGGFLLIWADNDTDPGALHAAFGLDAGGDQLQLYDTDGVTLIDSLEYGRQRTDLSYGRHPDAVGDWRPLGFPTPRAPNVVVYEGIVPPITFSHDHGLYDAPFELTLTCDVPDVEIYYTLDGSEPWSETRQIPGGRHYSGPIIVVQTTCIRVLAVKTDWLRSEMQTQSYLFPSDAIGQSGAPSGFPLDWKGRSADYEMDSDIVDDPRYTDLLDESLRSLPTMSLVMTNDDLFDPSRGIYANSGSSGVYWERPGSIELIYPDGREGFQTDCGVRIQGGWFRSPNASSKKSFRLLFKGIYGATKLRYPLFGDHAADEFDTITLRAGANDGYTWSGSERYGQFTRDEFARNLHHDMGQPSSHGMFVHLYVNGLYWGLYNPCERPDASFSASYCGGDKEDYDAFKHKGFTVSEGNATALNQMLSLSREAGASQEAYQQLQGCDPDGTRNPDLPHLMDVPNYIDYMIVNMWAGNWDWPWNNYWLARQRTPDSTGFKFYCWDTEDIMLSPRSPLSISRISDTRDVGQPHGSLRQNPEYRLRFADHLHRHLFNDGVLTPDSLVQRYQEMADSIELAIITESARWGDQHGRNIDQDDWFAMRDQILDTYLPNRTDVVLQQFRGAGLYPDVQAPVFHVDGVYQHGGAVATGATLAMEAPGTVWYTLDGTDPRMPERGTGGDGGPLAFVKEDAAKRVLIPTGPVDSAWRTEGEFNDSAWISGAGGVGYERSTGYEQYFDIDVWDQMYGRNTSCLIRIPFEISQDVLADLSNLTLDVRYDDGFVAYVNGAEVARRNFDGDPVWNSAAHAQNSDLDAISLEPFNAAGAISHLHPGENLLAIHALNVGPTSSDFLFSAVLKVGQETAGGGGAVSPTALEYTEGMTLTQSVHVKSRVLFGGGWSALNEATYAVGPVAENLRISEIMYHPAEDPNAEYIELTNVGSETLNLNLVRLTNGVDFEFPSIELAGGEYLLVVRDTAAFKARYGADLPIAGQYAGSLNNTGERVELQDAVGRTIHDFRFRDNWYSVTDGLGFSLTVQAPTADLGDKSAWRPSAQAGGSPGFDDADDIVDLGVVVINELLANSEGDSSDWIELYNASEQAVDLGGWFLSDSANDLTKYEIPAGTVITPGGYVVFYEDETFGDAEAPGCHVPFALSRNGETVHLHSGAAGALTGYSESEKFGASEAGVSLGRWQKSTGAFNFVALSRPTPELANAAPQVGPVVISEIMYNPAGATDVEYVELLNASDASVTLYDETLGTPWRFTDDPEDPGVELLLPTDEPVVLSPGQVLVLTKDLISFQLAYTVPADVRVLPWGPGKLANGSEKIQLSKPIEGAGDENPGWIRVDRVVYSDGSHPENFPAGVDPWPVEADGQGQVLSRIDTTAYGNDPANWRASEPSPGRPVE